jgi:hypothetical protein
MVVIPSRGVVNAQRGVDARRHGLLWLSLSELRSRSAAGKSNEPAQRARQMIQMAVRNKYSFNMQVSARPMAALATGYTSKKCLKTAGNDGMELVYLSQFTSTCS